MCVFIFLADEEIVISLVGGCPFGKLSQRQED
jgi:hypothetical protein